MCFIWSWLSSQAKHSNHFHCKKHLRSAELSLLIMDFYNGTYWKEGGRLSPIPPTLSWGTWTSPVPESVHWDWVSDVLFSAGTNYNKNIYCIHSSRYLHCARQCAPISCLNLKWSLFYLSKYLWNKLVLLFQIWHFREASKYYEHALIT